jgi:oligoendopeptidase F
MTILRQEVPEEDLWNVNALYPSLESWKKELKKVVSAKKAPFFKTLAAYKGTIGQSASHLRKCLDSYFETERALRKLYTYAHLRHDEDIQDSGYKEIYQEITGIYHQFAQETAWLEAEILSLEKKKLSSYLTAKPLQEYHFFLIL